MSIIDPVYQWKVRHFLRSNAPILLGLVATAVIGGLIATFHTPAEPVAEEQVEVVRVEYPLDINTATYEQLMVVPHIGPATAEQILRNRPFDSLEEVGELHGVGESKLRVFLQYLIAGGSAAEEIE